MDTRAHVKRWGRRFRGWVRFLAELWDAAKVVAVAAGLIVGAVVGTAVFALDVMPPLLLAVLVIGVAGLCAGLLQGVTRRLLPASSSTQRRDPPPPTADHGSLGADPYAQAAVAQRSWQASKAEEQRREEVLTFRRAVRLVREELLDNKHVLERLLAGEAEALHDLKANDWHVNESVLLEHGEPGPHAQARAAYRELAPVERHLYQRSSLDHRVVEEDPHPELPLETDIRSALEAIAAAVTALDVAEGRPGD